MVTSRRSATADEFERASMSSRSFMPAVCVLAALAGPASAQFASADISQLRYELIDLDPNDGIIPEIVITGASTEVIVELQFPNGDREGRQFNSPGSVDIQRWYGQGEASAAATAVSSRADLFAAPGFYRSFVSHATRRLAFTLSPHTGLRISALGSLDVAPTDWADTRGSLSLSGEFQDSGGPFVEAQSFEDRYQTGHGTDSFQLSGYLSSGEEAVSGSFGMFVYTRTQVSAVPEPSTVGMLLAGLALVGAAARRRATS